MVDAHGLAEFYQWWNNESSTAERKELVQKVFPDCVGDELDRIAGRNSENLSKPGGLSHGQIRDLAAAWPEEERE